MTSEFSKAVIERLGFYVYILKDPRNNQIFYIGKGKGNRIFSHIIGALENVTANDKYDLINEIIAAGYQVEHFILRHGISEELAFEIESSCIDLLGLEKLTNEINGHYNWIRGLKSADEVKQFYDAKTITIDEPSIIININRLYKRHMSEIELYNATRHCWRVAVKRNRALYALASYGGLVREVYAIQGWTKVDEKRWEFYGQVADCRVRDKYINQALDLYIKKGNRNPIRYSF